jgi:hypothetical protein
MSWLLTFILLVSLLHDTSAAPSENICMAYGDSDARSYSITAHNQHCAASLDSELRTLRIDGVAGFNFSTLRTLTSLTEFSCTRCALRDLHALRFISPSIQRIDFTENGIRNTSSMHFDRFFNLDSLILDANSVRVVDLRCVHATTVFIRWNPLRTVVLCSAHMMSRITIINDTSPSVMFDPSSECCEEIVTLPRINVITHYIEDVQVVQSSDTSTQPPLHIALEVVGGLFGLIVTSIIAHFLRRWCRRRRYHQRMNDTLASSPNELDNTYVTLSAMQHSRNDTTYVSLTSV